MADNFLEYRFEKVFGKSSSVDPETGYSVNPKSPARKAASLKKRSRSVPAKKKDD